MRQPIIRFMHIAQTEERFYTISIGRLVVWESPDEPVVLAPGEGIVIEVLRTPAHECDALCEMFGCSNAR